ncbi:MAG: PAS domain S-box protein [Fidelibacterota bacterium]
MRNKKAITPKRIILILGITIFAVESILMFFLTYFQSIPLWLEGLIDSTILVILVFPILFYYVLKPMITEIDQRTKAEKELLDIQLELEKRVEKRTKQLSETNDELMFEVQEKTFAELKSRKLASAVNNSPASVVITDIKGNIEYVNPKFTKLTGYTFEDVLGENPRILKSGYQSKEFYEQLWDTITSGKEWRGEFSNKAKNGNIYWESASIAPILDEKNEITHFVAVKEDITEQKAARELLKKNREELEESNNLKVLLLDIITHDLKNPAGVINGFSELLMEKEPTDEMVRSINDSSNTLLKVIDNATALSGIAMGDSLEKQKIDLNQMLKDIISGFDQLAKQANVEIEYQTPGELFVSANPIISEIFKNFLSNAIKYGKKGKRIIINATKQNGNIQIHVNDFGETILEESRKSIFKRQTRLDNTSVKGQGLGLAIVERIAEAHGAKVWVEPIEPTGNSFRCEMPNEP